MIKKVKSPNNEALITKISNVEKKRLYKKLKRDGYSDKQIKVYFEKMDYECKMAHKIATLEKKLKETEKNNFQDEFSKLLTPQKRQ